MRTYIHKHHRQQMTIIISAFILLSSFNNCSQYSSELDQSSSEASEYGYNNQKILGQTKSNLTLNSLPTADAAEYQLEINSGTKTVLSQKVSVSARLRYYD